MLMSIALHLVWTFSSATRAYLAGSFILHVFVLASLSRLICPIPIVQYLSFSPQFGCGLLSSLAFIPETNILNESLVWYLTSECSSAVSFPA